jgi:hypothetical protein
MSYIPGARLVQKVLEINTQSMEQPWEILFRRVETVRISERFLRKKLRDGMAVKSSSCAANQSFLIRRRIEAKY